VHCRSTKTNLCLALREQQNKGFLPDGTTRLARNGEPIRHFMGTSTFAEYTVMPEIALAKVSPEARFEHACLFACGLSTGLGAAMFTAKVEAGSTCVVFGVGMVGLGAVAGCRLTAGHVALKQALDLAAFENVASYALASGVCRAPKTKQPGRTRVSCGLARPPVAMAGATASETALRRSEKQSEGSWSGSRWLEDARTRLRAFTFSIGRFRLAAGR